VIGLEVHVQLATKSKLFCGCATTFGAAPNHQTCPVCLGLPGTLPVLNRRAVELAAQVGLALGCTVSTFSRFDRKNYFYPDLPKAWQTSQYDLPLCLAGQLDIVADGAARRIGITRVHLEEDAGKLVHGSDDLTQATHSLVDYNRTGVPLIEIVSEPDLRTPEEAYQYLTKLRAIVRYLGASDCNMEEGSLRCDANISLRPVGQQAFGTKAELKNMNSFKNVRDALVYEIERQTDELLAGRAIVQETRLWHAEQGKSASMRGKEEAHDYRYFPEPDLVPMALPPAQVDAWRAALPELPDARTERMAADYGPSKYGAECLSNYDVSVLAAEREVANYFEISVNTYNVPPKYSANLIMKPIAAFLNENEKSIEEVCFGPDRLGDVYKLQDQGTISGKMVKELLPELLARDVAPAALVQAKGMTQISDTGELEQVAQAIIAAHPGPAADVRAGKQQAIGFLVGQMMKQTRGQANPQLAQQIFRKLLG